MIIIDDDGVMHKVLPIDTLDKIRAEIEKEKHIGFTPQDFADGLDEALKIIDKYRNEVNHDI